MAFDDENGVIGPGGNRSYPTVNVVYTVRGADLMLRYATTSADRQSQPAQFESNQLLVGPSENSVFINPSSIPFSSFSWGVSSWLIHRGSCDWLGWVWQCVSHASATALWLCDLFWFNS